jgi:carbonic anhydrase
MKAMIKYLGVTIFVIFIGMALVTCKDGVDTQVTNATTHEEVRPVIEKTRTKEEQDKLTPDDVLERLKGGNKRFVNNDLTARDHSSLVRNAIEGQYPSAVVVACMDSRIPVEDIFDKGIGDIFVIRLAGNVINEDVIGSIEYGCNVAGAKLIVVMGHRYCGAVKSAVKDVQAGNMTALLSKIKPAISISQDFNGVKEYSNEDYVSYVAINHVKQSVKEIVAHSTILSEMITKGQVKIVAAAYNLDTGEVLFFEEEY